MRVVSIVFFLTLYLQAEIIRSTGFADPNYNNLSDAIEDAQQAALKSYQDKYFYQYASCLGDDFVVDEDDYNVFFVNENSVKMTPKHIVVEADFEVTESIKGLDGQFQERCEKRQARQQTREKSKAFFSHFHLGLEAYGWPNVYGAGGFVEIEYEGWGIYGLYDYQTLEDTVTHGDSQDVGSTTTVGGQVKIPLLALANIRSFGLVLGYDHVLDHTNNYDETLASSAFVWGLLFSPRKSSFEFGLLFKEFDDKNEFRDGSLSGGALVRYKLF